MVHKNETRWATVTECSQNFTITVPRQKRVQSVRGRANTRVFRLHKACLLWLLSLDTVCDCDPDQLLCTTPITLRTMFLGNEGVHINETWLDLTYLKRYTASPIASMGGHVLFYATWLEYRQRYRSKTATRNSFRRIEGCQFAIW